MSCIDLAPNPTVPARARCLSPGAAFYLQASITVSFLAGSSAPTPLYALYQARWHFSPTMVTVIFGVYALAVLAALLVAGRLSDHVGRRPVLLGAIVVQVAAMLLFAQAHGVAELLVARVVQGISVGAAAGAVGAGLLDLDRTRGTLANAVATPLGTATGAMLSAVLVQSLPYPMHLVYLVLAAVFVAQGFGVLRMAETHMPRPGALASLKPQLTLSAAVRGPMLIAVPALVAAWALAGFYASLGPALVRGIVGTSSTLLGALSLFVLASSAALATLALRDQSPRALTWIGTITLVPGVATAMAALTLRSAPLFFLGTALSGAGFGAGFQGAIRSLAAEAAPHERAGVLSVAFIVSYLAMGLPAIVAGYLVTRHGDIVGTAREFGVMVIALALLSLTASIAKQRRPSVSR